MYVVVVITWIYMVTWCNTFLCDRLTIGLLRKFLIEYELYSAIKD